MTTNLPYSIQKAADYADAIEQANSATTGGDEGSPKADTAAQQDRAAEVEKLQARYSSLQGKYNAEVPALHSKNKELEARLQRMQEENQSLRSEIATQESKKAYITEQDTEAYGEDMIDLVRRAAREESAKFAEKAAQLQSRVDQMGNYLRRNEEEMEDQRMANFRAGLSAAVPNWEAQNIDPQFLAWLNDRDPVYGFMRNEALQRAFNDLNVAGVAQIFLAYRNGSARRAEGLARQVAPTHSRGASPTPSAGQRTFTQAEIAQFYDEWRRGNIPDEEAARIEKDINAAVTEGRVIG
nr:MAG TPA: hypothetical protein [Caudoviricetes sp.]